MKTIYLAGFDVDPGYLNWASFGPLSAAVREEARADEEASATGRPSGIVIRVRDEGPGFDPETISDPLAPENLLKASGRGIFLIRSFMDEMVLQRAPQGGMEVVMVKRVAAAELGLQNAE